MKIEDLPSSLWLRLDRLVLVAGHLLLGAMAAAAPFLVDMSSVGTTRCDDRCDFALIDLGSATIIYGLLATAVLCMAALLLVYRPDRRLAWLPCSALAVGLLLVMLGAHLVDLGVTA